MKRTDALSEAENKAEEEPNHRKSETPDFTTHRQKHSHHKHRNPKQQQQNKSTKENKKANQFKGGV